MVGRGRSTSEAAGVVFTRAILAPRSRGPKSGGSRRDVGEPGPGAVAAAGSTAVVGQERMTTAKVAGALTIRTFGLGFPS